MAQVRSPEDTAAALDAVARWAEQAAAQGVELLVLPAALLGAHLDEVADRAGDRVCLTAWPDGADGEAG